MNEIIRLARRFISLGLVQWQRGDPLLMGAAIAYNALFAMVPLALAFVSIVTLFDVSQDAIDEFIGLLELKLPADVASFAVDVIRQSLVMVSDDQGWILVVSIGVALWSGSRAVYAVQKALRLVQGGEDDRGYLHTRSIGILVTVGAIFGVLAGYALMVFGEVVWMRVANSIGWTSGRLVEFFVSVLILVLGYAVLWVVYRFGPPEPVPVPLITAGLVEVAIIVGSRVIFNFIPFSQNDALAMFGVLGIILAWAYILGVLLVGIPIAIGAGIGAWSGRDEMYPFVDEPSPQRDEDPGSQERGRTPSPTAE